MRPILLGLLFGALSRPVIALFAHLEVPLSPGNLAPVLAYIFLIRGLAEELAKYAAARLLLSFTAPPAARRPLLLALLLLIIAFPLGQALDPAVHGLYLHRPHRLLLTVLFHLLVSAPWVAALVRQEPARNLVLQSAWRLALIALLDRESGLATAVLVLLTLQLARDAYRVLRPLLIDCS